jgi:hypothetical protein
MNRQPAPIADSRHSSGMPHAPAAMSRRFMAGVTGTAPMLFRYRRNSGKLMDKFLRSAAENFRTVCLTFVVLVVNFEVVDRMFERLVESQM